MVNNMNNLQLKLFNNLIALCENNEAFFYAESMLFGQRYFIFNYRLANYSQWLHDGALECRGVTFEVNSLGNPIKLASRPFSKFFNLNENPFTMDLDLSTVTQVWDKMDGSLISTMDIGEGEIWLKSKGSLYSEQAHAANQMIRTEGYTDLYNYCVDQVAEGNTVIMEYTGPTNRIVISYEDHALTVLGVRSNASGLYAKCDDAPRAVVNRIANIEDTEEFVLGVADLNGIEGYVVQLASGLRFKIKTEWYRKLHFIKDSISSQRRLFEAVVYETSDDVKAAFFDDVIAIGIIEEMEAKVSVIYNHMVDVVERYYERNKTLSQRDFAIKGQKELEKLHFGLAMSKYIGREVDYKATMVKHRKNFGIKDDPETKN